jgi:transcriptional regulator with XRE-family HTH domain
MVSRYECGRAAPSLQVIAWIAEETDAEWLLDLRDVPV